jgi:hypothetical protein
VPFQFNGSVVTGSFLAKLTPEAIGQRGSAFVPISLGTGGALHTSFSFSITNSGGISNGFGVGADGLVFVVQNAAVGATPLGDGGGSLGYQGIIPSLGIEFDTWNNGCIDGDSSNHVGVNTNGGIGGTPRINIGAPFFNNGAVHTAKVDYDGVFLNVTVDGVLRIANHPLDLDSAGILNGTNGYVGFTAATGGAYGQHDIVSWNFTIPAGIDIHPGSFPNSINLRSKGAVPVAFFGSDALDVDNIDAATCKLADAGVKMVGKSDKLLCAKELVDGDAHEDLVCHFVTTSLGALDASSTEAKVTCDLNNGTTIEGVDSVNIVPPR